MKNFPAYIIAMFFFTPLMATNIPDLTGTWTIMFTYSEIPTSDDLTFTPSGEKSESGRTLYDVQGQIMDRKIWRASVEGDDETGLYIAWYLKTDGADDDVDMESNIILSSTCEEISLSADISDIGEISKMVKKVMQN